MSEEASSIRSKYTELVLEAKSMLDELSIKDSRGMLLESGYSVMYKLREHMKRGDDMTESIEIIGEDKWLRLKDIWSNLTALEKEDKKLINKGVDISSEKRYNITRRKNARK